MLGSATYLSVLSTSLRKSPGVVAQASRRTTVMPLQSRFLHMSLQRRAANLQSGKPASDSWSHTKQNIKEEAASIRSSIESSIAGGNKVEAAEGASGGGASEPSGTSEILKDAKSITSEMAQAVPKPALLWGSAGIIPYVSTAGASVWLTRKEHFVSLGLDKTMDSETVSALLLHAQNIQVGFGAVLLSFLGAIHWGFEFSKYGGKVGNQRYTIGVFPLALGWPTLLLTPQMALIAQWASFVAVWFVDLRATSAGWVPKWYSTYRFWLTFAVGTSIIATLAGTNYYAPGNRSTLGGTASKLQEEVEADGPTKMKLLKQSARGNKGGVIKQTEVEGDVEAHSAGAEGNSYITIGNPKRKEQERKEQKKEEEQKRKQKQQEDSKPKDEGKEGEGEEGNEKKAASEEAEGEKDKK